MDCSFSPLSAGRNTVLSRCYHGRWRSLHGERRWEREWTRSISHRHKNLTWLIFLTVPPRSSQITADDWGSNTVLTRSSRSMAECRTAMWKWGFSHKLLKNLMQRERFLCLMYSGTSSYGHRWTVQPTMAGWRRPMPYWRMIALWTPQTRQRWGWGRATRSDRRSRLNGRFFYFFPIISDPRFFSVKSGIGRFFFYIHYSWEKQVNFSK